MNILMIDSTKDKLDVVVCKNNEFFVSDNTEGRLRHSEILLSEIDFTLKSAKLGIKDIDKIIIVVGPGSFTGIRVGLATVKAFCFALKIPVVGVNSLQLLAYNEEIKHKVLSIIPATKGLFYAGKFENEQQFDEFECLDESEIIRLKDDGFTVCSFTKIEGIDLKVLNRTSQNLKNAMLKIIENAKDEPLQPLYIQVSQAERQKINS